MENCKRCSKEFEVPKNAIEMVYAIYCKECIKKAMKKMAKMPLTEFMKMQAKQIGLK